MNTTRKTLYCRNCSLYCPIRKTSVDRRKTKGGWFCTKRCARLYDRQMKKDKQIENSTNKFFDKYAPEVGKLRANLIEGLEKLPDGSDFNIRDRLIESKLL